MDPKDPGSDPVPQHWKARILNRYLLDPTWAKSSGIPILLDPDSHIKTDSCMKLIGSLCQMYLKNCSLRQPLREQVSHQRAGQPELDPRPHLQPRLHCGWGSQDYQFTPQRTRSAHTCLLLWIRIRSDPYCTFFSQVGSGSEIKLLLSVQFMEGTGTVHIYKFFSKAIKYVVIA